MSTLAQFIAKQRHWSEKTFGPGPRTKGILEHLEHELKEVRKTPMDLGEWVDVIILGLDGAWRAGYSPEQIVDAMHHKQQRNFQRKWPDWTKFSQDEAIEHDRSEE